MPLKSAVLAILLSARSAMTLDRLHKLELSLMRRAFEVACTRAGLSTARNCTHVTDEHARLASIVQRLVEHGFSDPNMIAELALQSLPSDGNPTPTADIDKLRRN